MRRVLTLATGLLALGCGAGSPGGGEVRELRSPGGEYSFLYPAEWSAEPADGGTLVRAPEEGDWQAAFFFEVGSDPENRPPLDGARDLVGGLMDGKQSFGLTGAGPYEIQRGTAARVIYKYRDGDQRLVAWEIVAAPPGESTLRVYATASTPFDLQKKYLPRFEEILSTLRVTDPDEGVEGGG